MKGHTALDYYKQYKKNKQRCGRHKIVLPAEQAAYIIEKIALGWTPDVIIGRNEMPIDCSMRTLYRRFKDKTFDEKSLPMKGKRKPNGYVEKRGKQVSKRNISEREKDYPAFNKVFGHIEGDTIIGVRNKSSVITLVERVTKMIFTIKPDGRKSTDIEKALDQWFQSIPKNLFKSVTFDNAPEFSRWKAICNAHDVAIYFADAGAPTQRALNENSNGLLRKDGLPKQMDFNEVDQVFISSIADKRNNIPRKSLDYQTPLEVFLGYLYEFFLYSLI